MASKRMFSLSVIDTDAFLEMPCSTQALYFHLCMRADDDGFVASPKIITRTVGASEDDFKLLIAKRFILAFEDGVIVIKHWRIHNTLSMNRYKETTYLEDKATLKLKPNNAYTFGDGAPLDDSHLIEMGKRQSRRVLDEQKTNADKNSIDKNSIEEIREEKEEKRRRFIQPTLEEVTAYCNERGNSVDPQRFIDYYTANGWKVGKNPMKDWRAAVRTWERGDKKEKPAQELNDFYNMAKEWAET